MTGVRVGGQARGVRQPGGKGTPGRSESSRRLKIKGCDYCLVFMVIFLVLFGVVMMYSATLYTESFFKRQSAFAVLGLVVMFAVSMINYHAFKKWAPLMLVISFISMILVLTPLGVSRNNSARWIEVFGVSVQPAELFKIAVIIFNAALLNKLGKSIRKASMTLKFMGVAFLEALAVMAITDNLSSAIIVFAIAICMLFVARPNRNVCLVCVIILIAVIAGIIFYCSKIDINPEEFEKLDYRMKRILRWLQPEKYSFDGKNFQTLHSLYAIGSGSFGGKGLGNSTQKMILPEAMNDMIFAIVCEELGFVGSTFLLVLYGILMQRLVFIARNAKEFFGSLISVGILGHIGVQVALNVAVATNSMPNTGVTLPFFSYGGTALVILMAEMGIALSVSRHISLK